MMCEPLEPRRLFSAPIDTSDVALFDADGNPAALNRHRAIFILIHGDQMQASDMEEMAKAVRAQLPSDQWQVLDLDWSTLAHAATNASRNALAVGDKLASMVKAAGVPASRVNLIGFSMGGTVMGRTAEDLKTATTQVNRIIGVDPAAGRLEAPAYAADSAYSFSFCGLDTYGGTIGSLSADDAVVLTGLNSNDLFRHSDVFSAVTTLWSRDAGLANAGDDHVSPRFSIPALLAGPPLPWRHGAYDDGFDALVPCGDQSGTTDLGPLSVTYTNTRGHRITLS